MNMWHPDLRLRRAHSLVAAVMQEIKPFLQDDKYREAAREIENLFYRKGVEVLTDADRATAGLPDRGNLGWTDEELRILEAVRIQALLKPFQPFLVDEALLKEQPHDL